MEQLLANLLFTVGVVTSPVPPSDFQIFGATPDYMVEIDVKSLKAEPKVGGWQIKSTIKRTFFEEVEIEGKKKKGKYAIDNTTTRCAQDTLVIENSTLYTKNDEILSVMMEPMEFQNPNVPGSFVTDYIETVCNSTKNVKPPLTT